jgi:hypothetical protein
VAVLLIHVNNVSALAQNVSGGHACYLKTCHRSKCSIGGSHRSLAIEYSSYLLASLFSDQLAPHIYGLSDCGARGSEHDSRFVLTTSQSKSRPRNEQNEKKLSGGEADDRSGILARLECLKPGSTEESDLRHQTAQVELSKPETKKTWVSL